MEVFVATGVRAVVATNTLPRPVISQPGVQAGLSGGGLHAEALRAVQILASARHGLPNAPDIIAGGGIMDGQTCAAFRTAGASAFQYWSALIYRGPLAPALIARELRTQHNSSAPSATGPYWIRPLTLLIGAPTAFAVWRIRDENKIYDITNARKDTNLKEFQKLQEWATGNISAADTDAGKKNRAQPANFRPAPLRGYLKGAYGEDFRRPAFEIYCSVLRAAHQQVIERLTEQKQSARKAGTTENKDDIIFGLEEIRTAIEKNELARQINRIVKEEWFCLLMDHDFPLTGISLLGVDLSDTYLYGINLSGADLRGAYLQVANLQWAYLTLAQLQQAQLHIAYLQQANLQWARLQGAHLQKADLREAYLQGANLWMADLQGANLWIG
ncbi:hypothetical protein CHS0354_018414 [Potamilus streckersoni]|uniref:Dihydroorotate dehydrogenase catalytic domain-containing protein n=1 Tax=Potamilus streckersoni TaxID=2493646 RepID=A0AAE0TBI9_9BIVA|nr:hypothetical protein CHS0354_018414 [Potamilus streckersoni]